MIFSNPDANKSFTLAVSVLYKTFCKIKKFKQQFNEAQTTWRAMKSLKHFTKLHVREKNPTP